MGDERCEREIFLASHVSHRTSFCEKLVPILFEAEAELQNRGSAIAARRRRSCMLEILGMPEYSERNQGVKISERCSEPAGKEVNHGITEVLGSY